MAAPALPHQNTLTHAHIHTQTHTQSHTNVYTHTLAVDVQPSAHT